MPYCSLELLRASLRLTDSVDDVLLQSALDAADDAIDQFCGRNFTAATEDTVRYYASAKPDYVEIDDITAITEVATSTDGATWVATTNYQAEPLNNLMDGIAFPYTRLRSTNYDAWPNMLGIATVRVTGRFQFGYLPAAIVEAAKLHASKLFARNASPLGVAGWGDLGVMRVYGDLDADAQRLCLPFRKYRAAL